MQPNEGALIKQCPFCEGTGSVPPGASLPAADFSDSPCPVCAGLKRVIIRNPAIICLSCEGTGKDAANSDKPCFSCRGRGSVTVYFY